MQTGTVQKTKTASERSNFRLWLQSQLTERCRHNARYSLRAFAQFLEMDASSLSQILSGKRPISKKAMAALCDRLNATPEDLRLFGLTSQAGTEADAYYQLSIDQFSVISDWYHYAILELIFVDGFKADPKWISKKLSITVEEAKAAVERLLRLGLLLKEGGSYVKANKFHTNESKALTSSAHRELQKQLIGKALLAIDECVPEQKDITSMTMAIDMAKLPEARELIRRFRRDLCALLEEGDQTEVYNLTVQLYPISKIDQENA